MWDAVRQRIAEMEAKYAGSAVSEARCKPMPPSLMAMVAWTKPILSTETLQTSVALDLRQS